MFITGIEVLDFRGEHLIGLKISIVLFWHKRDVLVFDSCFMSVLKIHRKPFFVYERKALQTSEMGTLRTS